MMMTSELWGEVEQAPVLRCWELLTELFEVNCWLALQRWSLGADTRSNTIDSVRSEMQALAACVDTMGAFEFASRLAAAAGEALAVHCRLADDDLEREHDQRMIALGVESFRLRIESTAFLIEQMDAREREECQASLPERLRAGAAGLGVLAGTVDFEIPTAAAIAVVLATVSSLADE